VLTTKRALACTKHYVAWLPVGCQLYTNCTAVTLSLEEHVVGPFSKVPRQRHWNRYEDIGPRFPAGADGPSSITQTTRGFIG
jgi:hypothetical protein